MTGSADKEKSLKTIRTIGKTMRIAFLVLCILAFVAAGTAAVGGLIFACLPENWLRLSGTLSGNVEVSSSLSLWAKAIGEIAEGAAGEYGSVSAQGDTLFINFITPRLSLPLTKVIAVGAFAGSVQVALCAVVFLFFSKFGKVLEKNSSPFGPPCIRYLKITAFVMLGWAILGNAAGCVFRSVLFGSFMPGGSIGVGMIVVALLFLLLAYVFQYGAKLQRESDETL